jgi:xanthine dehydrogenase YagS FAD-binding subunit
VSESKVALVSVAVALANEGGVIRAARLAAGGVGTKPWRLRQAEAILVGLRPGEPAWRAAAERAVEGARPLAYNGFKVELLKRTLVRALETVGGNA